MLRVVGSAVARGRSAARLENSGYSPSQSQHLWARQCAFLDRHANKWLRRRNLKAMAAGNAQGSRHRHDDRPAESAK
eukprot:scaffold70486_cov20-Prasinocladus_malaysianus.AAC.1